MPDAQHSKQLDSVIQKFLEGCKKIIDESRPDGLFAPWRRPLSLRSIQDEMLESEIDSSKHQNNVDKDILRYFRYVLGLQTANPSHGKAKAVFDDLYVDSPTLETLRYRLIDAAERKETVAYLLCGPRGSGKTTLQNKFIVRSRVKTTAFRRSDLSLKPFA
ncbi:hypothetical protein, partial [Thiorhodococcus fuscus]